MSTSSADYYKVLYLKEYQSNANVHLDGAKQDLNNAEEDLAHIQAVQARCQERVNRCKNNADTACNLVDDAQSDLEEAEKKSSSCSESKYDTHPFSGLKEGEKIPIAEGSGQMEYWTAISNARELMADGRLDEAIYAEKIATDLYNMVKHELSPEAQFISLKESIGTMQQIRTAGFVNTKAIPARDEDLMATLKHGRYLYDDGISEDPQRLIDLLCRAIFEDSGNDGNNGHDESLPEDVIPSILSEVFEQIELMETCHIIMEEKFGNNEEDAMFDSDHEEDASEQQIMFKMNDSCWEAVEKAIRSQITLRKEANAKELQVPSDFSSKIARYNPRAHFRFVSEKANASVNYQLDAMLNCKLRSRPTNYSKKNPVQDRIPFEFRTFDNSGFDVDGDLIALCGDTFHNELREEENFVGFQKVPYPDNLDSSNTLCELRDTSNSNEPWDTNTVKKVYKGEKRKKEWFGNCIADAENNLVWAADSRTGTVHAFSTEDSHSGGPSAKLSFPPLEAKLLGSVTSVCFASISKCGDTIIGGSGTGRLSAWNVNSALEDNDDKAIEPRIMLVDHNKNFQCGDLQYVGDSQLLVAPLRFDFNESDHSRTVRLYDVNAEAVVGLLCGTLGEVSIGKQYCVQSHNAIFAMSKSVGVVFDTRTYQPTVVLHADKRRGEQILGVPSNSSTPVAFTYGSEEDMKCWDLRMPGSHVYTMATGNTIVQHLFWHEDTSSLLASTRSSHVVSYGRCMSGYMYGNDVESDKEDEICQEGYWPRRAVHDRFYFGSQWHCDCQHSYALLQYPFQNGRGMHERPARLKCG